MKINGEKGFQTGSSKFLQLNFHYLCSTLNVSCVSGTDVTQDDDKFIDVFLQKSSKILRKLNFDDIGTKNGAMGWWYGMHQTSKKIPYTCTGILIVTISD